VLLQNGCASVSCGVCDLYDAARLALVELPYGSGVKPMAGVGAKLALTAHAEVVTALEMMIARAIAPNPGEAAHEHIVAARHLISRLRDAGYEIIKKS
jgi:hypothetical protein